MICPECRDHVLQVLAEVLFEVPNRIVQQAITEATSAYWIRRAETFDAARGRPDDFAGAGNLAARRVDESLAAKAAACRARAYVSRLSDLSDIERAEILHKLGAVATVEDGLDIA